MLRPRAPAGRHLLIPLHLFLLQPDKASARAPKHRPAPRRSESSRLAGAALVWVQAPSCWRLPERCLPHARAARPCRTCVPGSPPGLCAQHGHQLQRGILVTPQMRHKPLITRWRRCREELPKGRLDPAQRQAQSRGWELPAQPFPSEFTFPGFSPIEDPAATGQGRPQHRA